MCSTIFHIYLQSNSKNSLRTKTIPCRNFSTESRNTEIEVIRLKFFTPLLFLSFVKNQLTLIRKFILIRLPLSLIENSASILFQYCKVRNGRLTDRLNKTCSL